MKKKTFFFLFNIFTLESNKIKHSKEHLFTSRVKRSHFWREKPANKYAKLQKRTNEKYKSLARVHMTYIHVWGARIYYDLMIWMVYSFRFFFSLFLCRPFMLSFFLYFGAIFTICRYSWSVFNTLAVAFYLFVYINMLLSVYLMLCDKFPHHIFIIFMHNFMRLLSTTYTFKYTVRYI